MLWVSVYSKNEHETPSKSGDDEWVIIVEALEVLTAVKVIDQYERIDGCW